MVRSETTRTMGLCGAHERLRRKTRRSEAGRNWTYAPKARTAHALRILDRPSTTFLVAFRVSITNGAWRTMAS